MRCICQQHRQPKPPDNLFGSAARVFRRRFLPTQNRPFATVSNGSRTSVLFSYLARRFVGPARLGIAAFVNWGATVLTVRAILLFQ